VILASLALHDLSRAGDLDALCHGFVGLNSHTRGKRKFRITVRNFLNYVNFFVYIIRSDVQGSCAIFPPVPSRETRFLPDSAP
jgi:hypothetical protein